MIFIGMLIAAFIATGFTVVLGMLFEQFVVVQWAVFTYLWFKAYNSIRNSQLDAMYREQAINDLISNRNKEV